jgi:hypothetical protein
MAKTEKLKKSIRTAEIQPKQNGGKRAGAGMKKGTKIKRTLEKEEALRLYRERVTKHADEIFNAQFSNAKGNVYIYQIIEVDKKKKHILVTDPDEILKVLDANQGQSGLVGEDYFIVTVEKPDNQAIKDMLDRTFGTATQTVVTEDDKGTKQPITFNYVIPKNDD